MIEVMRTGRNLTMRHLSKTCGVAVAWLHEVYDDPEVVVKYVTTTLMAADLYTKPFLDKVKWEVLCNMNNLFDHGPDAGGWDLYEHMSAIHDRAFAVLDEPSQKVFDQAQYSSPMPPGFERASHAYGWQDFEGCKLLLTREPRQFRAYSDRSFNIRTTWIRTLKGWVQIESNVAWVHLLTPAGRISEWCDRGLFVFSRERPACSVVNHMSELSGPEVLRVSRQTWNVFLASDQRHRTCYSEIIEDGRRVVFSMVHRCCGSLH
jgi:hypothetical protein